MILVDSCGWIEVLTDGPLADAYQERLEAEQVLVPTVVTYEVCKFMLRERSVGHALAAVARLRACHLVSLNDHLALEAADLSLRHGLAMADAIVYATALAHEAPLVTGDADLKDLPGVEYIAPEG